MIRSKFPLILVLAFASALLTLSACQPAAEQPSRYEAAIEQLGELIPKEMERAGISGLSIALVDDQEIVWATGFGHSDEDGQVEATGDTIYRVGSISKLFTDLATMRLYEQGKLDIDADVSTYVPEFSIGRPFDDDKPTTLRQLMAHCSGFLRESPVGSYFDDSEPSLKDTVESIYGIDLVYPPETHTKYSNIGVTLVGYTVERVSGQPYADHLREHILRPIGMADSDYVKTDEIAARLSTAFMWVADGHTAEAEHIVAPDFKLATVPAGNLYSSAVDLCKFHSFIFAGCQVDGEPLISPETLEMMLTRQYPDAGRFGIGFVIGEVAGRKTYGHGGAVYGFSSEFIGMPDEKIGVVVLANEDVANTTTGQIAVRALELMCAARTGEEAPAPQERIPFDSEKAAACVGVYANQTHWAEVSAVDGGLAIMISGQRGDLEPVGEDEYVAVGRSMAGRITFVRGDDGSVTGFAGAHLEFQRVDPEAEYEYPAGWDNLTGSYGPEFIPLIITKKYGNLYAFVENVSDCRLTPLGDTLFKFEYGLYEGETLEFFLSPQGEVERVVMAHVEFLPID